MPYVKTRRWYAAATFAAVALTLASAAWAEGPVSTAISPAEAQAILEYWTPERMASARPMPLPAVVDRGLAAPAAPLPADARPGYSLGWNPKSGQEPPDPLARHELDEEQLASFLGYLNGQASRQAPAAFGTPPANPVDYPNYGTFARWTWYGNYLTWPTSTIGKLFFTIPGQGNFVCSATVIGRSTIATAGHCVSSVIGGTPTWHTNVQFCPSYYKGGGSGAPHPGRGCWGWNFMVTTTQWYNHENLDRDYACVVLATSGTVHANKVGNVTGWIGRSWNWPPQQATLAWGYPAGPPFPGYHIVTVAGNEWYSVNMNNAGETSVDLSSKYIGSDMTGGGSGGPWWLGTQHPNAANNYADTDGVIYTGWVGGPWLNGVNSHKRCLVNCNTPPTASAGLFWQEMGSPPFTSSGSDPGDSEDIFANCLSHANNNP